MQNLQLLETREVLEQDFKIYGTKDEPLFLANDVANWIGHTNSRKMLDTVDEDEKIKVFIPRNQLLQGLQSNTEYNFLTEYGLYEVLMQSRKPIAKKFKKEVKKILKEIRQTGKYEAVKNDYELITKTYKGKKVLTLNDLAYILGVNKMCVYNFSRTHGEKGYLLENDEMLTFKRENPKVPQFLSGLLVFDEKVARSLAGRINKTLDTKLLDDYFYTELTDFEILMLDDLASDLQNIIHRRASNTAYAKPLSLIVSKIYVDMGFLSEVTDDLNINTLVGWQLLSAKQKFKQRIVEKLKK